MATYSTSCEPDQSDLIDWIALQAFDEQQGVESEVLGVDVRKTRALNLPP